MHKEDQLEKSDMVHSELVYFLFQLASVMSGHCWMNSTHDKSMQSLLSCTYRWGKLSISGSTQCFA